MSYVPPHRRSKVGRNTSTDRSTSIGSRTRWQRHHQQRRTASEQEEDFVQERSDKKRQRCVEDEIFFSNAFSFVRCINLSTRPEQWKRFRHRIREIGFDQFLEKVERFDAVNGREVVRQAQDEAIAPIEATATLTASSPHDFDAISRIGIDVAREWDTTQNSLWDKHVAPGMIRQMTAGEIGCALSHVSLWRELAKMELVTHYQSQDVKNVQKMNQLPLSMLIFEDDVVFFQQKRRTQGSGMRHSRIKKECSHKNKVFEDTFLRAFRTVQCILPEDWDIFYLGFSDRGERRDLVSARAAAVYSNEGEFKQDGSEGDLVVQVFRPTYGFHTHAYAIRQPAAEKLLQELPVVGPIDVWLADNQWFGLNVYCAIIANEGWKNTGAPLVGQDRSSGTTSSVGHSGR